ANQNFKHQELEAAADAVFEGLNKVRELRKQAQGSGLSREAKSNLLPFLDNKVEDFNQAANAAAFVQLEAFLVRDPQESKRNDPDEPVQVDGLVTRGESFFV